MTDAREPQADPRVTWASYLRRGLSRKLAPDRVTGERGPAGSLATLKILKPYVARHWKKAVVAAVLLVVATLLAFPVPLITRYLIDNVILARRLGLLVGVIALLAAVKLSSVAGHALQRFLFTRFEQLVLLDIQQDVLGRTLRLPKAFFDDKETGYLMSRVSSDVQGLRWFFSSILVNIATETLRFVGGVALLFYLEWRLAIVGVVVLPGLVFAVRFFSQRIRVLSHHGMERHAHVSRRMQESLSSAPLIKAFGREDWEVGKVMSELRGAFQIALERVAVGSAANVSIKVLGDVARVVVLAVGAYEVIIGQWTLGSLLAFLAYLGYVYGPAQFLATANFEFYRALASLERVSALFDVVPEENLDEGKRISRLKGYVEFKDVSFSYDGRESVLEGVSCVVRPGEHVAIVGPSGVGKTTFVSLILRFYKPTDGQIFFDHLDGSEYELSSLRQRIGYVSQSILLLSGTIMDNLRYGNADATEGDVMQAAKVADIHDFIMGLPAGYDARVGERGVNLSEGQKQRLAIARALIRNPDILVLDEPTSALDTTTEESIFDSMPTVVKDKTLFVVAHRPSTIRKADRVLLLKDKKLTEAGTPEELLSELSD
jgi:subfamily B ATP-binding cassette protein MsbA